MVTFWLFPLHGVRGSLDPPFVPLTPCKVMKIDHVRHENIACHCTLVQS